MKKRLHISVSVDDMAVRVILVDAKTGEHQELQPVVDYIVEFVQKRTERCKECDRTYPESEIVTRNGEQLCQQCDLDKYPIRMEDIPF